MSTMPYDPTAFNRAFAGMLPANNPINALGQGSLYAPGPIDIGRAGQPGWSPPGMPGTGGGSGWGDAPGLAKANLALSGLSTIGNLWASMKQLKLAKQQFGFQRDFANANFANQLRSYNTSIEDRARSRGFTEGQSQDQIQRYVSENSLTDNRKKKG